MTEKAPPATDDRTPWLLSLTVNLERDTNGWTLSPQETADAVLQAVGGDEQMDYCEVHIAVRESGTTGTHPGVALSAADNERRQAELEAAQAQVTEDPERIAEQQQQQGLDP